MTSPFHPTSNAQASSIQTRGSIQKLDKERGSPEKKRRECRRKKNQGEERGRRSSRVGQEAPQARPLRGEECRRSRTRYDTIGGRHNVCEMCAGAKGDWERYRCGHQWVAGRRAAVIWWLGHPRDSPSFLPCAVRLLCSGSHEKPSCFILSFSLFLFLVF